MSCYSCRQYRNGAGTLQTRKRAVCTEPTADPFLDRDFIHNVGVNIPQMGCGGLAGYAAQTDIATGLREISTKDPHGCNTYLLRDMGGLQYLHCDWQQPDYRPLTFLDQPRQEIKNMCRGPVQPPLPGGCTIPGFVKKTV